MVLLIWKWMDLFLRPKSFKMLGLTFYSKLGWGSYIISIAKTAFKKFGALICSMKFLSPEVVLYLYKSTIRPCMEYCCHVWAGAPSCYLELLDKLQKRICRTVGPSVAASLEPLAHRWNVANLGINLVDILQNWLNWFHFLFLEGGLLVTLTDCMNFLSPFLDVTRVSVDSFFPRTARPWNPLLIECFPSTYNQNGFKGCVRYILASLFFKSKRRHLWN